LSALGVCLMVSDLLAIWMPVSAKEDTCKCIAFTLGFVARRMLVVGSRPLGATCSRLQGPYLPRRARAGNTYTA
jgi:hypothetical protein